MHKNNRLWEHRAQALLTFSSPTAYGQIAVAKLSASFLRYDLPTKRLALATNNNLRGKTVQKTHITLLIIFSSVFFSAKAISRPVLVAVKGLERPFSLTQKLLKGACQAFMEPSNRTKKKERTRYL